MRLVLGNGTRPGLDRVLEQPGTRVCCDDPTRCEVLRAGGVDAAVCDPTDPDALAAQTADDPTAAAPVRVVLVVVDDVERAEHITAAARTALPTASVVVLAPVDADAGWSALDPAPDRRCDPRTALVDRVLDAGVGAGARSARLQRTLRGCEGPLAVVTHDNPDPDAIASGVALSRLAERVGVRSDVCYFGEIAHHENRAFVNLLDLDLRALTDASEIEAYGAIALVDHARPGVNDGLPDGLRPDVVVDHHPPRAAVAGGFVDVRTAAGATSTLLIDHCHRLDCPFDERLATALLYGIRVDTDAFRREVAVIDFEAAARVIEAADLALLDRIATPRVPPETLETIGLAIRRRTVEDRVLTSFVGRVADRDAVAQAADHLLGLDAVDATLVAGVVDETVYCSARSRGGSVDLGETLRVAFGRIGDAGGHVDMAGAQIPLGILGRAAVDENEGAAIADIVHDRFFEALRDRPTWPSEFADRSASHSPPGERDGAG